MSSSDFPVQLQRAPSGEWIGEYSEDADIDEDVTDFAKEASKLQQQVEFVFWVIFCVVALISFTSHHAVMPFLYSTLVPILFIMRFRLYWSKDVYFLLDFCYFGNLLFLVFLMFAPNSPELFQVVFILTNGPLLWGVIAFRNSMVFHNTDKMTSLFIHILPALVSHIVRWDPDGGAVWWRQYVNGPFVNVEGQSSSLLWLLAAPILFFFSHACCYHILVYCILKPSDKYQTSFRFLQAKTGTIPYKVINSFGSQHCILMYNVFNMVMCTLSVVAAWLMYTHKLINTGMLAGIVMIGMWNGGSYYAYMFAKYKDMEKTE